MTLANAPTHLKEDARQGDPKAIAAVINHIIEPQGLTSQARVSNGSLLLLVESEEVPHAGTIVPFLHAALVSLGIDGISNAKIGGRQKGSKATSWQETVDLENPPDEIIDAAEQMSQDEYHNPEGDEDMPFDDDMPLDDDVEDEEDGDEYQEDNDDDIADKEKPQKPKSKSQLPLVLLLLLLLLLALGGAAFFFLPGLRSYLPFLPQEGAETPPDSTPTPAATPTATAAVTPASPPTPAATPTATATATPAPPPTPAATPTAAAPATTPTTGQTSVELIQAVRKANQAWEQTQQAESADDWQQIATLWREASQEMAKVPPEDSRYDIAQDRIGRYEAYALFAEQMALIKGQ